MTIGSILSTTRPFFRLRRSPLWSPNSRALVYVLLVIALATPVLTGQTYTDLLDFAGTSCCPQYPFVMAQGRDGNLYGTISAGGTNNQGFVFQITPTGAYKVLYNFDTVHGSTPIGGLTVGVDGNL